MANKSDTYTFNVKSDIGKTTKDASSLASEFKIMGVSLNSVKAGLTQVGTTAKASFATMKAGIMSTGIGALVIAVGSLVTYFTNTKRGADQLDRAFTAMGATVDVLTDRLSKVGEAISFVFSGEFKKAGEALKGTFSGIADEVEREVSAMVELKKRTQELRDADMEFMVQKAQTRQEIEKARLIAEDETKSAAERLDNLKKALELEAETTQQELELARERMKIQEEEMALSENSAEDEQELARLKTEIIEKETASIKMRRRVVTEVNALEREIQAEEKARAKEKQDILDAEIAAQIKANDEWNKLQEEKYKKEVELAKKAAEEKLKEEEEAAKKEEEIAQQVADAKKGLQEQGFAFAKSLAGEGTNMAKGIALAQATISGIEGVQNAYTTAQKSPYTALFPGYPLVQAGLAAAFSAAQIQKILSADTNVDGGGGGSSSLTSSIGGATGGTPAPQMLSGAADLTGLSAPEPVRAYVVTDEMTNSQDQLANIRRRATI
ncbi:MAG: hypothetical protein Unbinned3065contig1007_43 [Prokaryotic dsDNA virus sp.]|mgnify:CR=1 FL=1|nr:MAG: hypothetical protein Unbinned3065contig1007_43 [Prokaryotic dsDNA virus sp.]|tara:strand:- start:2918 stop:4405 length:1488 start_codon:yes stop_codon:yes gene_type:complete